MKHCAPGSKRNFADGGIIRQETADELMARMTAKYGAPSAGSATQPAAQPVQRTDQQPKPAAPMSSGQGIMGLLKNRGAQIDKAAGYANGGIVKGKGTPTSDDVPVSIKGKPYNLSDTEAVLPSKTRQALGELLGAEPGNMEQANRLVEQFIEQTNGKPPVRVGEGSNLAPGGLTEDEARQMKYEDVTGTPTPTPNPQPAANQPAQTAGGSWSFGKSGPNLQVTTGDAAKLPADTVQRGIAAMRGQLAEQPPAPTARQGYAGVGDNGLSSNYVGSGPTDPDVNGRNAVAAPSGAVQRGIAAMRGQLNPNPQGMFSDNAKNSATAEAHVRSLYPAGTFDQAPSQSATQKPVAGIASNYGNEGRSVPTPITKANPGAVTANGFNQDGINYRSNPTIQDGISKVTAAGQSPLYTNINPGEAVAGLKNQTIGGDAASVQEGLARHARANAITQSIIDQQPVGGIGILPDRNAEDNAEKTARWRQDELLQAAKYGNRGADEAIRANGIMAAEGVRSATAARGQDISGNVAMRGQDITANTEASRISAESPLKKAQTEGIMAQSGSAKMMADLQQKAIAGDQQALATLNALTGKVKPASDRFLTVQGGEEIGPDGMTKIKRPGGVFDAQTQRFVPMDGGQQQGQAQSAPPADKREVGKTYQTPKGPMVWRGNGWEAA